MIDKIFRDNKFLRIIYSMLDKIQRKTKDNMIKVLVAIIFILFITNSLIYALPYAIQIIVFTGVLMMTILLALKEETLLKIPPRKIYFSDKFRSISFLIIGVGALISGIYLLTSGYIAYGLIYTVLLQFILFNRDRIDVKRLLNIFTKTVSYLYIVYCILTLLYMPLSQGQYVGLFYDPNSMSMFSAIALISSIYALKVEKQKSPFYITSFMAFASSILSESRTGIGISLLIIISNMILDRKGRTFKSEALKGLSGALVFILMLLFYINITPYVSKTIYKSLGSNYSKNYERIFMGRKEKEEEPSDLIADTANIIINRPLKGINTDESITSGRTILWKAFIKESGFMGHTVETVEAGYWGIRMHAHNAYLQIWYSYGLISLLGLLSLTVCVIYFVISRLRKIHGLRAEEVFALQSVGAYFAFSMFFSTYHVFSSFPALVFTVVILLSRDRKENRKIENNTL